MVFFNEKKFEQSCEIYREKQRLKDIEELRDRFAISTLNGLILGSTGDHKVTASIIAGAAYKIADAMLEARKKQ